MRAKSSLHWTMGLLTSSTEELLNFVESCALDDKAFGHMGEVNFTRMKVTPEDSN